MDVRFLNDDVKAADYIANMARGISGYVTSYIGHMDYLIKEEFGHEMRKILPYIDDDLEFLSRFKHVLKNTDIYHIRKDIYLDAVLSPCPYLTQEGLNRTYNEFKEEIDEEMKQLEESW